MRSAAPAALEEMVLALVEARAELSRWVGGVGMPYGVAASRVGVAAGTLRSWERRHTVPSLRFMARWGAVFGYRLVVVDFRGLRWDQGFVDFGEGHWGDRSLLDEFAGAEARRLGVALRRARQVTGIPDWQLAERIGCRDIWRIGLWEGGKQFPRMEFFTRHAAELGLCAALEPVGRLADEASDYPLEALRPDDEDIADHDQHDEDGARSWR